MRFKSEEVQNAYDAIKRHREAATGSDDWSQGKRLAYSTALQALVDNCTWILGKEEEES